MSPRSTTSIVVGAGSVGLPTAVFLAEAGLKTLVIDQFAGPGQGSNKAAIGGIRATHSPPGQDPPLPRVAARSSPPGRSATATTSSGSRAATPSSPTASRRSGRSRTC